MDRGRLPVPENYDGNVSPQNEESAKNYLNRFSGDVIPGDAYSSCVLPIRILNTTSISLSCHWWWCLDQLLALFINTTEDTSIAGGRGWSFLSTGFKGAGCLLFLILLLPFAFLSFLIWLPLQFIRPRAFSYYSTKDLTRRQSTMYGSKIPYQQFPGQSNSSSTDVKTVPPTAQSGRKRTYTVVTSNVCLMPEFLAKMNNVSKTVKRAEKISNLLCGKAAISDQTQYSTFETAKYEERNGDVLVNDSSDASMNTPCLISVNAEDEVISLDSDSSFQWSVTSREKAISENFPNGCDFLCLQEVFDRQAADVLLKGLGVKYPYIIYDVAWPLQKGRLKLLNSGLCIASKFPFLDVDFKAFPDGYREDKLACKGLLMTKVYLGEFETGKFSVGYLATTHLQAITHSKASEVRCKQLNLLRDWLHQFKMSTKKSGDFVTFDVICGDFNFDPESYFEEGERKCDFRRIYKDPCVDVSGQQHDWVIGTELKAQHMHDPAVNSAKRLQRMVISELERPRYVASTLPADCLTSEAENGKRRVDYILYQNCENRKMVTIEALRERTAEIAGKSTAYSGFTCD